MAAGKGRVGARPSVGETPGGYRRTAPATPGGPSQATTSTTGATSTTAGAEPSFTELEGPSTVTCDPGASTVVAEITFATADADTIEHTIDGEAPGAQAGFGPSGTIGADLPCDGGTHVVAVTPLGAGGSQGPTEGVTITVSGG
ncbi:MAG: hypothetical protein IPM45_00415 [Acidimicrobiales bacterium]|nr:hypothetical protein [Acidimicrobiales bacterium]